MDALIVHSPMTSPGKHASAIDALPNDVPSLLAVIRGLFIHGDWLEVYGLDEGEYPARSRETLQFERRLDNVFNRSSDPLTLARPFGRREVVTCRDYAVATCGVLRQKAIPARVRCGFAKYFSPSQFEDHWICEYWLANERRWARADAQLDEQHRKHLDIVFDSSDLPTGEFITAEQAWDLIRNNHVPAKFFGHADAVGAWFVWVNLARDCLSLMGKEVSLWDTWRQAKHNKLGLSASDQACCDKIAASIRDLEQQQQVKIDQLLLTPFWIADTVASPSGTSFPNPALVTHSESKPVEKTRHG